MVPIFALMPTAARLAWMIGAIATIAGNEEAIVNEVSNPSGTAGFGEQSFGAFATSAPSA